MNAFFVLIFLACTPTALLNYALPLWKADKAMRIEDVYKWTYQATRGGEHAAPDRAAAKKWLDNEWSSLGPRQGGEAEWQPLCGKNGEIGRFNLRPFKDRNGSGDDLVDAFVASAAEYRSEPKAFTDAWIAVGERIKKRGFNAITYKEWLRLDESMKAKGYPAIHHSDTYNGIHKPAYRVLTRPNRSKLNK